MLKFGNIDKVGEAGSAYENRYRVRLPDVINTEGSALLTGWMYCLKRSALNDQDDYMYDINEAVAIEINDDLREGVILGAINTVNAKSKTVDPDIECKTFKDGSIVSYDRKNHVYTLDIKDGTINIKSENDLKIDSASGKVIINGGGNKGMLILDSSVDRFNKIENLVNDFVTKFNTHTHILTISGAMPAAPGVPATGTAAPTTTQESQTLTPTQAADIEDQNAQH